MHQHIYNGRFNTILDGEKFLETQLDELLQSGKVKLLQNKEDDSIVQLLYADENYELGFMGIIKDKNDDTSTLYPLSFNGTKAEVIIDEISVLSTGIEAIIYCHLFQEPSFGFYFFDTNFIANIDRYVIGESYKFSFYGFAYNIAKSNITNQTIPLEDDQTISLKDATIFLPIDEAEDDKDHYKIHSTVSNITTSNYIDNEIVKVDFKLYDNEENGFSIPIYTKSTNISSDIQLLDGEHLSCVAWICGVCYE